VTEDVRFTEARLDELRLVGDKAADDVAIDLLAAYGEGARDEGEVIARAIGSIVKRLGSADDPVVSWLTDGPGLPAWADEQKIAAGQRLFGTWPLPIATALFCAALPTTLAAPHGAAVLAATSDLAERRHVAERLAGTGRMLFDALGDTADGALLPGNQGYVSILCVRLLHAVVRQGLLAGTSAPWDATHGTPINQEDLLGTLTAFSVTVLDGLAALGVRVTAAEADAFLHTWCVIGALMGIDGSLLPLETVEEARALAAKIARRQLRPGPHGPALAHHLFEELRLAMPPGCGGVPAALTWRLVPHVARLLEVPRPGVVPRWGVGGLLALARLVQRVPWLRRIAVGPGAEVGRSVLLMHIDREQQPGGPEFLIESSVLRRAARPGGRRRAQRRTNRRRRRGDVIGVGTHVGPTRQAALDALVPQVPSRIDAAAVHAIASEGYPFWEGVEAMVERNRQITAAYVVLSRSLAEAIAGPGGRLDANWCTFAAWTSKTVGNHIAEIPRTGHDGREVPTRPATIPGTAGPKDDSLVGRLLLLAMRRGHGRSLRILAAGNRVIFMHVGLAVVAFLEQFPTRAEAAADDAEERWARFWKAVEQQDDELALADASWVLTPSPPPKDLYLGFRQYLCALRTDDLEKRSQHVLAGNILVAAYEQRRLDGHVWAALAAFGERAMRRLTLDTTGEVGGKRKAQNSLYARGVTRRLRLHLPGEELRIHRPMTLPPRACDRWHTLATDADVTLPALQALITRYQLAAGGRTCRGARNWTSFDERMRTIGQLFRLRQRQADLFHDPFSESDL
jgi:hypothetical protein